MFTIDMKEGLQKAKQAFDERRLSGQHNPGTCQYRDSLGLPCVVGAMISDQDWEKHIAPMNFNECAVDALPVEVVNTGPLDERQAMWVLTNLQGEHDGLTLCRQDHLRDSIEQAIKLVNGEITFDEVE